ncbi:MAG TPA: hypothetical protein VGY55_17435 [Pirellulales bacterium]|jgi:hypothetical protein|nr:hypothetical protein [Pirellulales bacterium]
MIPAERSVAGRSDSNGPPSKKKRMTKGRWILLASALVLGGIGVAWAAGYFGPDSRLAELKELQAKIADPLLSDQDKRAFGTEMRKKVESLPQNLQQKVFQEMGSQFMKVQLKHVGDILAMPPEKQAAELDKDLDRIAAMSKQFEQMSKANPGSSGNGGPPGFPSAQATDAQRAAFRNQMLSSIPADTRAQFTTFFQLLQARASQRGIPLPQFGPR